jgi:hypothetical protein
VRFSKLMVNPLTNSVGGEAYEVCFRFTGRYGFTDLEPPFPQPRFDQLKGKFNALAVHESDSKVSAGSPEMGSPASFRTSSRD